MSLFAKILATINTKPSDKVVFNFIARSVASVPIVVSTSSEGFDSELRPTDCDSVEELISALTTKLNLHPSGIDCLHAMLAIVVGVKVSGPMLWMHCVGPSSSMKTTLSMFIASAQDRTFAISRFTGLYSGMRGVEDNSLVPKIQHKTLVIHDLTPLLQASKDVQNEAFGDLRDMYSGVGKAVFKNGVVRDYSKITFGIVTCVTDTIRSLSRSDLGERFLMADIDSQWDEQGNLVRNTVNMKDEGNAFDAALDVIASGFADENTAPSLEGLEKERSMCWGLMLRIDEWMSDNSGNLHTLTVAIKSNTAFKAMIESISIWIENARCPVPSKHADLNTISRPALPHRTIKQLVKLTTCLCIVAQQTTLTPEIIRRVRKFAFDTAYSKCLEVMNCLARNGSVPKIQLALMTGCTPPWIAHFCNHLVAIGVVEESLRNNGSGNRGRDATCFSLTAEFKGHAEAIGIKPVVHNSSAAPLKLAALLQRGKPK